jgi:hypothetical protein
MTEPRGCPKGFLAGKEYRRRALARHVMVVAVFDREVGDWSAYIDAVPGIDHGSEWGAVVDYGDKIPKDMAAMLFPLLAADKGLVWRE